MYICICVVVFGEICNSCDVALRFKEIIKHQLVCHKY